MTTMAKTCTCTSINRPLAGSSHIVRNKLRWDASFASQRNLFRIMWRDPAKGLFKREVTSWRHKWLSVLKGTPKILVGNAGLRQARIFYPGIYRVTRSLKTILTYPVSTCAADRSFSSMNRLKTPLRSVISDARLSSLSVWYMFINTRKD